MEAALILPDGGEHLLAGDTSVGRDADNGVVLDDETVSRRHAIVAFRKERWWVADTGSVNGTLLNGERLPAGVALQLRHADRLELGRQVLLFSSPTERDDPQRTSELHAGHAPEKPLPEFQRELVAALAAGWLDGATLDSLPSNRDLAQLLQVSEQAVKGALRRLYARAGLTSGTSHAKRRELCRVARSRGWI